MFVLYGHWDVPEGVVELVQNGKHYSSRKLRKAKVEVL